MSLNERLPSPLCIPKVVRDLLWTVSSPHILSCDRFPVLPAEFGVEALKLDVVIDWLNALVSDPAPILAFLQDSISTSQSLALGVYFSKLLEFWLQREPHDFHVESSIKFFLLNTTNNIIKDKLCDLGKKSNDHNNFVSLEHYVGPHLGENLAWRVQEVDRKLAMRRGDSVHAWLKENYSDSVESHIVLRGYLFEPLSTLISTAATSMDHDWFLHRNHTPMTPEKEELKSVLNPCIAINHLRGWWTTDMETDLPAKLRANPSRLGESRFVILPKLHWLAPVVAVKSENIEKIVVHGDETLNLADVNALQLDQLITFVRNHFRKDEFGKSSPVAMPLLVAEIVQFPEYVGDDKTVYWHELSRGFILDSTRWDPSPLSQEPVRYRRTRQQNAATGIGDREYEIRQNDCVEEGFIKPDVDDTLVEDKRHQFTDPTTMGPRELCHELVSVLSAKNACFSHAELKRSTAEYFLWRQTSCNDGASDYCEDRTAYLRACFKSLIFEANDGDESRQARRVGYLLVDVFNEVSCESSSNKPYTFLLQECNEWTTMLAKVANDSDRWEFLNLILRAIDLTLESDVVVRWIASKKSDILTLLDKLLAAQNIRWNAIVVEMVRVFHIGELLPGHRTLHITEDAKTIRLIFDKFVGQHDWQNAERLVTVVPDHDMVQRLFKHMSLLNMTKALKRLQQIAATFSNSQNADFTSIEQNCDLSSADKFLLMHPIDHTRNRSYQKNQSNIEWKYVDCAEDIQEVVRRLKEQELSILIAEESCDQQTVVRNILVAIDCEWRPQFLTKACDDLNDRFFEDQEGLSLYQLAVGNIIFVIDVQVLGLAAAEPLSFIWRPSSRLMLIGFCVSSDILKIKNSFPHLSALFDNPNSEISSRSNYSVLELRNLALSRHIPAKHWGLSQLHHACLGEQLDKEQQCSDWGSRPLSTSQIEYAAKDAFAVQRLSWHLLADIEFEKTTCSIGDDVREFLINHDGNRNALNSWTMATELQPLGKQQVELALQAHGINARIFRFDKEVHEGLVVKSIAMIVRKEKLAHTSKKFMYVVVVLPLNRSIDIQALATLLEADTKEISLADQVTLVRVFGYSRGCLGPIGLRAQQATQIVLDSSLQNEKYLLCGAGATDEVYAICPAVLIRVVNALVACVVST
ncbi:Predicted 3'-5' exonuclease [Plasmopara halstedii]|uniref:Predicted 3'-5' exonuclease n=1 Tax=Plasmopara halstedii TaxID=4781 RepID=A0A0N7L6X6_PLAHL|nr:Predicted 3'-5' exonuclease [Plasmopara halstedii]CEG45499.1 Predicted 3'-5' exonuclease [Plasmopara halstedii]|eukprot:XP_024581868.1 Predicted 3'-5' exonuclease [Plasmopara halstedii]